MAQRVMLLCLLWLGQLDYSFVVAQGSISLRLCLWPQLETRTISCSSDGSSLIFIRSIVMTRLLGGLNTCTAAKSNDAPEINDCRITLGTRDSYFIDINRLCADKPSCNVHGNGNVSAYIGQSLCGFGMENSTIRNLVILTLQCYAVQVTQAATTTSTRTTSTTRQVIPSSSVSIPQSVPMQLTTTSLAPAPELPIEDASAGTVSHTDNGTVKVIAGASVGGAVVLFCIVALLVWLRRRGVACCCAALSSNKRGRFGGSSGLDPLYDDVLLDEQSGDGGEGGGGRAVEQLRRMIAEEQSKQARKSHKGRGSRAASSVSGRSAGRRHRHRSSRHVHANSDNDDSGGTTRRRSRHRSAGKTGHSTTAASRHSGGHRHRHRSRHHQQKRHRTRPSAKHLADGGEWRRSTVIVDDQSSVADVELLSNVGFPAVPGEEAAAGDEWVDETPSLGLVATSESGLSSEGAPDCGSELTKPRSGRRPHHRHRRRGVEAKASRSGADGAGKTNRSSCKRSSDDEGGRSSQPVDTAAVSSRERRRQRRQTRRLLAAGVDGSVAAAEGATDVQEGDGSTVGAGSSAPDVTAGVRQTPVRRGRSRRERESAGPSVQSDDGSGRGGKEAPVADGERRRSSSKSERAAKTSRRAEQSEGRSSRRRRCDANTGEFVAAVRGRTEAGESKRRRERRVQLPKTKSRRSQKRSLLRKEYEMRRNDKFVSDSSESDSGVASAVPSRPSDGCQLAASHPSAELLEIMKEQQEQRRQRQQQSEKRDRRPKEKKSSSHGGKSDGKKRRSGSRTSAAAAGGGADRSCSSQLLAADVVAEIAVQKDHEIVTSSDKAGVHYAAAAAVSPNHSPGGYSGGITGLCQYEELSTVTTRCDECTYRTLDPCEPTHQQESTSDSSVFTRNSTIATYDLKYDTVADNDEGVYHCVVVDANQNMSACSVCLRREDSCECLNSVVVDAFSHNAAAPTLYAFST